MLRSVRRGCGCGRMAAVRRVGVRHVAVGRRELAKREEQVRDALRAVRDRDLGRDVVTLGMAKDISVDESGARVSCKIESLPARGANAALASDARAALAALPWAVEVDVEVVSPHPQPLKPAQMVAGLSEVANVVAVASGKGGVGKSTVAVNLAIALHQLGARVGVFDADLYGPSVPTLLGTEGATVEPAYTAEEAGASGDPAAAQMMRPVTWRGAVPTMSIGYASSRRQGGEAAIMRGPMASNVLRQLLTFTQWGPLDFLVVDLPPGTGDIQLTLTQSVPLAAAVVVTTPHRLALPDVRKGIDMFARVRVPTAALVENMAFFEAPDGSRHRIFGAGHARRLRGDYGIPHVTALPLVPAIAELDPDTPGVMDRACGVRDEFLALAEAVATQVAVERARGRSEPRLTYSPQRNEFTLRLITAEAAWEQRLPARELRLRCRCAACVDESTGRPLLRPEGVPEGVEAVRVAKRGNYGVAVTWSDGHDSSIYSYEQVEAILREAAE